MPAVLFTPCPPPVYVLVPDSEQRTSWTVYLRDVPDPTRRPAFPVRKGCVPFFGVLRFNLTQHEVQVSRFKRQIASPRFIWLLHRQFGGPSFDRGFRGGCCT